MLKLRTLVMFALVLLVVAVGLWMWFANVKRPLPTANVPDLPGNPKIARSAPVNAGPGPSAIAVPSTASPATAPPPRATPTAKPVLITSSVVPGIPVVRGFPATPPPVAPDPQASGRGPGTRPVPQTEEKADLEKVQFMIRDFRTRLGENPVGSNAEIMRAVMGGNSARATLGPPAGQGLNEQGELIDRWGTAYFFHQLAKESMEIRSAGPDRTMYTGDDLLTR